MLVNPLLGHVGQYFNVRNNDSEYGLPLITRGLLRENVIPYSYNFSRMVVTSLGFCYVGAIPTVNDRTFL